MSEPAYPPPRLHSILCGLLAAVVLLFLFAFLGDIVKWTGAVMLFMPARLGLLHQVGADEIQAVDFKNVNKVRLCGRKDGKEKKRFKPTKPKAAGMICDEPA
ncbi:MAG: hypothetical protein ACUVRJ_04205 [Candidatus Villigracilaceae bacterium]